MEKILLKVEPREGAGKKVAKDLRKNQLVPAVVYKGGKDALKIQCPQDALRRILHTKAGENVIVTLQIGGSAKIKDKTVVIKEVQRDPVKDTILHVDFNEISLTDTLKVNVPVHAHGEAEGVKKDGGILEHVMWELQVECLPTAIPEKIEIDVSTLAIGAAIYVKNVIAPEGVKVLNDPEQIVFIVKPPKAEVPKEAVAEEAVEPELIRKKKEAEEGEAPAEAKAAPEAKKEEKK